jgi:hypothetical protein
MALPWSRGHEAGFERLNVTSLTELSCTIAQWDAVRQSFAASKTFLRRLHISSLGSSFGCARMRDALMVPPLKELQF